MNPLAILLAISLLANVAFGYAYLGQRDTAVIATTETKQATGAAQECSKGVETLQDKAKQRHKEAAPLIEAAKQEAQAGNKRADEILSTPAAAPGDDCRSAQARVDAWWDKRGQK